jgi:hypothetical protein
MKNIGLFILLVCFFLSFEQRSDAQCYVPLADASGFNTDPYQAELDAAAAKLCAIFDTMGFGGQFKVYDFGFYLHQENTTGGYPEPFAQKIAEVQALSPYYLIFGKQTDRSGVYTKFWVELRLPDSLCFDSWDTIGRGLLLTSLDLTANSEYGALGNMPDKYHFAEIRVMDKLKVELNELRECCYYQQRGQGTCDAPCLSADELKALLEQLGFKSIPIKILGPSQARGSVGERLEYSRTTDCAELDIEMEGISYINFAVTINNIMLSYPDSTSRAEILDESCFCQGGVQYLQSLVKEKTILLVIYLWDNPLDPLNSTMYTFQKAPDHLGQLPFKGHFPKLLDSYQEKLPLNMEGIKSIATNIFQKNGFSLTSIDFENPSFLDTFDIYNKILHRRDVAKAGFSNSSDFTRTNSDNMVNYFITTIIHDVQNIEHRNYIVGAHIAHEFFHQILGKSCLFIKMYCGLNLNSYDQDEGHCRKDRNLMFPGTGLDQPSRSSIKWTAKESQYLTTGGDAWKKLYVSGDFYPKKNEPNPSPWERISPTFKYIVSLAMLLYEIEKKYGSTSNELSCAKKLIQKDLSSIKFNSYEVDK